MTGTYNINLHHFWYNLDGWVKKSQQSGANVDNINKGLVHINVSEPTDFKMSEGEKMLYNLGGSIYATI